MFIRWNNIFCMELFVFVFETFVTNEKILLSLWMFFYLGSIGGKIKVGLSVPYYGFMDNIDFTFVIGKGKRVMYGDI